MTNPFDRLNEIRPKAPARVDPEAERQVEENAQKLGFVRDADEPKRRYRRRPGERPYPTISATMRVSVESWNRFIEWCDSERMTYREAFDRLTEQIREGR